MGHTSNHTCSNAVSAKVQIHIAPTVTHGLERWTAKVNGQEIGSAWSRQGIMSLAKQYLNSKQRSTSPA